MSSLLEHHKKLNEKGEGKCSVPMWSGGYPDGFCDNIAHSEVKHKQKYDGYVPALACPAHGGMTREEYELLNQTQ